jgi:hypothetical protein
VNGTDGQSALRQWRGVLRSPVFMAIVGAAALISAVDNISLDASIGATFHLLVLHLSISAVSASVASLGIVCGARGLRDRLPPVPRYGLAGLLTSPFVFISVAGVTALVKLAFPSWQSLTSMFGGVAVTVTVIALVIGVLHGQAEKSVAGPSEMSAPNEEEREAAPPDPPFIHRLPPKLGRELTRLSACDHYVEAHTRRGRALILLRFSDALGELAGADGFQIHRSHWVAGAAVRRLVSEGRAPMIELDDGTCLPVSRSRIAEVRARVASGAPPSASKSPDSSHGPFETGREDAT